MKLTSTIGRNVGILLLAAMAAALVAAACGGADEPAEVDTAAITDAVQEAVTAAAARSITQEDIADLIAQAAAAAPSVSQGDIEAAVSKAAADSAAMAAEDIAAQITKAAEENPALTAAEVDEMIADAVAQSQAMAAQEIAALITKAAEENPALTAAEVDEMIADAVAQSQAMAAQEIAALIEESTLSAADISEVVAQAVKVETKPVYAAGGQKYGGTLKIALIDGGGLDPHLAGLSDSEPSSSSLTYDKLAAQDYDGTVLLELVESWEGNADLSAYTVKLHEGVMFHHGPELTSADVKFSWDRMLDESTASPFRSEIDFIKNITTPEKYTVVFELEGSNVFLPDLWHGYHAMIVPDGITNNELTSAAWGSGPYTLIEHNPPERTAFRRFEDYWKGTGYFDEIVFFYMPEEITRIEALKSGAVDFMWLPDLAALENMRATPGVVIKQEPTAAVRTIIMQTYEGSRFSDKNLRKAMQYAVNRDFVRQAAQFSLGANANDHPVGPSDQYYWKEQPIIKQDIEKAKDYLAKAGYPDGIDIVLNCMPALQLCDLALAFRESVAAAGINVEVSVEQASTYWSHVWIQKCCPFATGHWGPRPAIKSIGIQLKSGGAWNESFYNNPRLDELLDLANTEIDFDVRKEYFREMQEILIDDVPTLYLMHAPLVIAHQERIKGVRVHTGLVQYHYDEYWIEE